MPTSDNREPARAISASVSPTWSRWLTRMERAGDETPSRTGGLFEVERRWVRDAGAGCAARLRGLHLSGVSTLQMPAPLRKRRCERRVHHSMTARRSMSFASSGNGRDFHSGLRLGVE